MQHLQTTAPKVRHISGKTKLAGEGSGPGPSGDQLIILDGVGQKKRRPKQPPPRPSSLCPTSSQIWYWIALRHSEQQLQPHQYLLDYLPRWIYTLSMTDRQTVMTGSRRKFSNNTANNCNNKPTETTNPHFPHLQTFCHYQYRETSHQHCFPLPTELLLLLPPYHLLRDYHIRDHLPAPPRL